MGLDIKMAAENAVRKWVKRSNLSTEIMQSEQALYENKFSYRCLWALTKWLQAFYSKCHDICFVSFQPPCLCPSEGHKHGVSMHILINLDKTLICFFKYLPPETDPNLCETVWIFIFFSLWFLTLFIKWFWWWCDSENWQLLQRYA